MIKSSVLENILILDQFLMNLVVLIIFSIILSVWSVGIPELKKLNCIVYSLMNIFSVIL